MNLIDRVAVTLILFGYVSSFAEFSTAYYQRHVVRGLSIQAALNCLVKIQAQLITTRYAGISPDCYKSKALEELEALLSVFLHTKLSPSQEKSQQDAQSGSQVALPYR